MKLILFSRETYRYRMQGNLTWSRIGKSPFVLLGETRPYSFIKSIAAHVFYKLHDWAYLKSKRLESDRVRVLFPDEWKKEYAEAANA